MRIPYKGPGAFSKGDKVSVQAPKIGFPNVEAVVQADFVQTYPSAVRWIEVLVKSPGWKMVNPDGLGFIEDVQCLTCEPFEVTRLETANDNSLAL